MLSIKVNQTNLYLYPTLQRLFIELEAGGEPRPLPLPGFEFRIEKPVIMEPVDHRVLLVVVVRTFRAQKHSARQLQSRSGLQKFVGGTRDFGASFWNEIVNKNYEFVIIN
jgi:hypothetical protein